MSKSDAVAVRDRRSGHRIPTLLAALFRPRPWPLALALAAAIGAAHTLAMLPPGTILGTGPVWDSPRGIVPGGMVDMGQELMGYRYLARAPWMLPFLSIPHITPPEGMNAVWLDPVPWLGLLARPVSAVAGHPVNLLGLFLFAAFVLPGVALAGLLRAAGQRGLLAAAAAALLADPMPSLLLEWGHMALCARGLVIVALALYVAGRHGARRDGRTRAWAWFGLLALALLTHPYLFVMVGGIWAAALGQAALDRDVPRGAWAGQAVLTLAALIGLGVAAGIVSPDLRAGGTAGFGLFSVNLASPFVPQLSGAIPPLRGYWLGLRSQTLAWPGIGVWVVVLAALALPGWRGSGWRGSGAPLRRHAVLAAVLLGFTLFALSNRVMLGARVLLEVPLPERLAYALGAFRASGRFIWPVTDALLAVGLLALLRQPRRGATLAVLAVACVLQVVDAGPIRAALAASAARPLAPVFDRARAAALLDAASALMVFPSSGCVPRAPDPESVARTARLDQANVDLQLLASERDLPLNTVVNSRLPTDCAAEAAARRATLWPGVAYFYLTGDPPTAAQLGGRDPATACDRIDWLLACRIPR